MRPRGSRHHPHGRPDARCQEHGLSQEFFLPQLRRLLRPGPFGDRPVYDSLVHEIVNCKNPLDLFEGRRKRSGVYLIEALYLTHTELAANGDQEISVPVGSLGYTRWVAWRRFDEVVRSGALQYGRDVQRHIKQSREDVREHLRNGWKPAAGNRDSELTRLLDEQ